jgi:hypothetical protein
MRPARSKPGTGCFGLRSPYRMRATYGRPRTVSQSPLPTAAAWTRTSTASSLTTGWSMSLHSKTSGAPNDLRGGQRLLVVPAHRKLPLGRPCPRQCPAAPRRPAGAPWPAAGRRRAPAWRPHRPGPGPWCAPQGWPPWRRSPRRAGPEAPGAPPRLGHRSAAPPLPLLPRARPTDCATPAPPWVGDSDHHQGDLPASRSIQQGDHRGREEFSTPSRPALRAGCGRPPARRQRRALPLSGPPGARRATPSRGHHRISPAPGYAGGQRALPPCAPADRPASTSACAGGGCAVRGVHDLNGLRTAQTKGATRWLPG